MSDIGGVMKQIMWFDGTARMTDAEPEYVFLHDEHEVPFTKHAEAMTGYDMYLAPVDGGGAYEPKSKTWVSELDAYVVIYRRVDNDNDQVR